MSKFLFKEFDAVSAKQWKQKIQVDLKGADYNDTLIWQSLEGIHVKPFYHRDEMTSPATPIPGQPNKWSIGQHIFIDKAAVANKLARDVLARGAEALFFTADKKFNFEVVCADLLLNEVTIYFNLSFLDKEFIENLIGYFKNKQTNVYFNIDILGHLASTGNWHHNLKKDHETLEDLFGQHPSENIICVDSTSYQNAGANNMQQLAYSLAHANEYLNHLKDHPNAKELVITFMVAIGANYFFEISKIRALRLLYATLAAAYGLKETCHIVAMPSKRNKTLYDYNLNMLRTTTECMSAAMGGANTVCNMPYDALYHKSNEFGERISRNQLLILKAESYLDVVSNPADGSYFIESITQQLAEKALELFKEIEKNGGLYKQLEAGTIQKKIKESAKKEQDLFDEGGLVLVGTNKYANENDRMKDDLELYPFVKLSPRKTIIEPIIEKRLAENHEKQRLENEI